MERSEGAPRTARGTEALCAAINGYFAALDKTRIVVEQKNGTPLCVQTPYTPAGLAAALGMSREALFTEAAKPGARGRLLLGALARVEAYLVERALLGELTASVSQLLLKDFGYGAEREKDSGGVYVTLEDPEGFGR